MHQINLDLHVLFHALSDPSRVRMVRLFLRARSELCLCELAESLNEPEYKLSRHLKILKNSGFISSSRDGKWIYHSLVNNKKYLRAIFQAVNTFPDAGGQSEKDYLRFKKRVRLRENGRCRKNSPLVMSNAI